MTTRFDTAMRAAREDDASPAVTDDQPVGKKAGKAKPASAKAAKLQHGKLKPPDNPPFPSEPRQSPQQDGAPRRGRPPAKHSNPDYVQATAYILKATHLDVKTLLVRKEKEFSDLVQELLDGWLREQA